MVDGSRLRVQPTVEHDGHEPVRPRSSAGSRLAGEHRSHRPSNAAREATARSMSSASPSAAWPNYLAGRWVDALKRLARSGRGPTARDQQLSRCLGDVGNAIALGIYVVTMSSLVHSRALRPPRGFDRTRRDCQMSSMVCVDNQPTIDGLFGCLSMHTRYWAWRPGTLWFIVMSAATLAPLCLGSFLYRTSKVAPDLPGWFAPPAIRDAALGARLSTQEARADVDSGQETRSTAPHGLALPSPA